MSAIWTHLMRINVLDKGLVSPIANCAFVFSAFYIALGNRKVATAVTATNVVAQCCYVLLCVLAFENSTAWLAYLNLAAMTTMPLFTLSSSGYFFFQAINFFNVYNILNEIDADSIQQIARICLHAYLSFSHLDSQTNRGLQNMKDMLLYTKELQLLRLSRVRKIGKSDLGQLSKYMRLGTLINEFKYDVNEPMFLIRAIIRMVWKPMIPLHILGTFFVLLDSLSLLVRRQVLDILDASEINWSRLYSSIVMEFGINILTSQASRIESYVENETNRVGQALEFELFRLPLTGVRHFKNGFDLPYLEDDLISRSIADLQKIFTLLPGVVTNVVLLYMQVGWFVFTPLVVKGVLIGISGIIALLGYPSDKYFLYFYDEYVSINTNEIYHNIRSIKMFGWERMYLDPKLDVYATSDDRKEDNSKYAQIARVVWFIYNLIEGVFSELSTGISIYLYCQYGEGAPRFSNGDVNNIFYILSSLNNQLTDIKYYFNNAQKGIGYIHRVEELLKSRPIDTLPNSTDKNVDPIITIDDGEFKWGPKTLAAKDVTFTAKPGDLVAVVGKTASGKSSLLYSLCSEVEMTNGTGLVNGSVAYVEQSPWIMSGTLRDNILFGREFDKEYYNRVIYACALDTDIKGWKDRDLTTIGERGINISGGQKTRLALARALYSKADIYILDDLLSAIDAHVKLHILDHVVMNTGMLKDKIRIVSSNDDRIIPYFNTILTVDDCCVTTSSQLAKEYRSSSPSPVNVKYIHNTDATNADTLNLLLNGETNTKTATSKTSSNIMYILKLCGLPIIVSFVLLTLLDLIGKHIVDNLRLDTLNANTDSIDMENNGIALKLIYIEMAKQFVSSVSNVISNKLDSSVISKIKYRIKDIFERSLVYAPLSFYDRKLRQQITADKYQVRELASKIIEFIALATSSYMSSAFALYSICINRPQLLIAIPFLFAMEITKNVILKPLKTFLDKFKYDAHVEGDKISDVIADGKHLIRIYGVGKHFTEKYIANVDEQSSVKLPTSNIHDFQRLIYNILHDTISTICNLCVVLMSSYYGKRLTSGNYISYRLLVGDFSYYLSGLTDIPRYLHKITKGVSLLREYTDTEQETLFDDNALNPKGVWPTKGKIEFKDFSMKYREDLEYSLKNINLTINPSEKIGIVGRTGAGKSSIARVIFRLINNNLCSGSITIDGYDINKMDLGYLRPKLGIIPQDPTLFNSSFKKNFDPLEEYNIEDIWAGVVKCGIAELVQPKRDPLDNFDNETWEDICNRSIQKDIDKWNKEYKDGTWPYKLFMLLFLTKPKLAQYDDDSYIRKATHGLDTFAFMDSDYSNGQKQIISLCRLVIRKHKLIILDEATSSVDLDTDQDMHDLIRSEFKDSTVLTIAHRLETIMKSDRIIVMDRGQIAEVGTPAELLQANGLFSELVKANDFGE